MASRVAQISGADCLILLSDVNGFYSKNPKIDKNAKLIKEIKNIDEKIEKIATKSVGEHGTGGMKTKIDAAKVNLIPSKRIGGNDSNAGLAITKPKPKNIGTKDAIKVSFIFM